MCGVREGERSLDDDRVVTTFHSVLNFWDQVQSEHTVAVGLLMSPYIC